MRGSQRFNMR